MISPISTDGLRFVSHLCKCAFAIMHNGEVVVRSLSLSVIDELAFTELALQSCLDVLKPNFDVLIAIDSVSKHLGRMRIIEG